MKKVLLFAIGFLIITACSREEKQDSQEAIKSNDIEKIRAVRESVHKQYEKHVAELALLDEAIARLDTVKKFPLVKVLKLRDTVFTHFLELQGNVETKQNIIIYPEHAGVLTQLNVKAGDNVKQGQVLARIDDGGLSAQVAQAEAQLGLSRTTYERQKNLWDQKIGSEIQYLQAKTNFESQQKVVSQLRAALAKTLVKAPFSGTIDQVMTERGKVVAPGEQLFRIVNLSNMYVSADVPETYVTQLKTGATVQVFINAIGKSYQAKVRQVSKFINPNNRTFNVEVVVPNTDNVLRPNQVAVLRIEDYKNTKALLVPETIITDRADGKKTVYVAQDSDPKGTIAVQRVIETGKTAKGQVEIISGLSAGESVITDGAKTVRDQTRIQVIQ
jgi:membrane fusion protein, multidrug efflux system